MSRLFKNTIIYSIVSVLQKSINFLLLPVYTFYLTPEDYGVVGIVNSLSSFLTLLFTLSLGSSVVRLYYKYKNDVGKVSRIWGTSLTIVLINSVFMGTIFWSLNSYIFPVIAKGIPFYPYILIGLISVIFSPTFQLYQASLQARQKGKLYGLNNMAFFLVNLGLTLFFLLVLKLRITSILLSVAITNFLFFVYAFIRFLPEIKLGIDRESASEVLKFSLPFIPHSLSGRTMTMIDRFLLNGIKGSMMVGIYHVGFQFGNLINIFSTAVNKAYSPWFFEQLDKGENGRSKIKKMAGFIISIYSIAAVIICIFGVDLLTFVVSERFQSAYHIIPFIAFAYVFHGIYQVVFNGLMLKSSKIIPIITFSSAIINAILNLLLIPEYGIIGASIASLISKFILSIIVCIVSYKRSGIKFSWVVMYLYSLVGFIISILLSKPIGNMRDLILKIIFSIVIIFIVAFIYRNDFKRYLVASRRKIL